MDSSIQSIVYLVRQCYGSLCFAPDNKTHESKTWCLLSAIQNEAVIYLQMYIKKTAVQEGSETGRTAQTASFILLLRQGSGPGAVETS